MPRLNLKHVRGQFPALGGDAVFLDNAGGSQVAKPVADRIFDFMFTANVQLGASRGTSVAAGKKVAVGRNALATMFNADRPEEVVTGATATQFFDQLARSLLRHWQPNDEDVVTDFDHEANIGRGSACANTASEREPGSCGRANADPRQKASSRFSGRKRGSWR